MPGYINPEILDKWLQSILWDKLIPNIPTQPETSEGAMQVLRFKGVIQIKDDPNQWIIQGVRELFDKQQGAIWKDPLEERMNRLVFIGNRYLSYRQIQEYMVFGRGIITFTLITSSFQIY